MSGTQQSPLFYSPPVMQAMQPTGGGISPSLAAALIGRMGGAAPAGGAMPQIPLSSLLPLLERLRGGGMSPAISGVNSTSLVPATSAMTAAPVLGSYAGGFGGPGG